MRTIAVLLCDNDFHSTFRNLLHTVDNMIKYIDESHLTEKHVRDTILNGISFHYAAFQNTSHYHSDIDSEETVGYLRNKVKILFNDDAESAITTLDHDGGSWYLECNTGEVHSF